VSTFSTSCSPEKTSGGVVNHPSSPAPRADQLVSLLRRAAGIRVEEDVPRFMPRVAPRRPDDVRLLAALKGDYPQSRLLKMNAVLGHCITEPAAAVVRWAGGNRVVIHLHRAAVVDHRIARRDSVQLPRLVLVGHQDGHGIPDRRVDDQTDSFLAVEQDLIHEGGTAKTTTWQNTLVVDAR
jgi:hypothetical protein